MQVRSNKMRNSIKKCAIGGLAIALIGSSAAFAHHSAAAFDFSPKGMRDISGTVRKVEWTNPHVWVFLDVPGPDGNITTWGLEMASPGSMRGAGLKFDSLKAGEKVTVHVGTKRDGKPQGIVRGKITWADGRTWVGKGPAAGGN